MGRTVHTITPGSLLGVERNAEFGTATLTTEDSIGETVVIEFQSAEDAFVAGQALGRTAMIIARTDG